jgi:hypothetical protein
MRPSTEKLFEHEWLKNHWGLNKVSLSNIQAISVGKAKLMDFTKDCGCKISYISFGG